MLRMRSCLRVNVCAAFALLGSQVHLWLPPACLLIFYLCVCV